MAKNGSPKNKVVAGFAVVAILVTIVGLVAYFRDSGPPPPPPNQDFTSGLNDADKKALEKEQENRAKLIKNAPKGSS